MTDTLFGGECFFITDRATPTSEGLSDVHTGFGVMSQRLQFKMIGQQLCVKRHSGVFPLAKAAKKWRPACKASGPVVEKHHLRNEQKIKPKKKFVHSPKKAHILSLFKIKWDPLLGVTPSFTCSSSVF